MPRAATYKISKESKTHLARLRNKKLYFLAASYFQAGSTLLVFALNKIAFKTAKTFLFL
jgi:hypothetical protein